MGSRHGRAGTRYRDSIKEHDMVIDNAIPLDTAWEMAFLAADTALQPTDLIHANPEWKKVNLPGTAASGLRQLNQFRYGEYDFDDIDIWFRCEANFTSDVHCLHFEGLAGLASVFWNECLLFESRNMFLHHALPLNSSGISGKGVLSIRFASLTKDFAQRRARPRWKTRLVEQQQLRWIRTTLLGRMPGWSPPAAPIGPFRPIYVEMASTVQLDQCHLTSTLDAQDQGTISLRCELHSQHQMKVIELRVGDQSYDLQWQVNDNGVCIIQTKVSILKPRLWFPHTHGIPHLYPVELAITLDSGTAVTVRKELGNTGFRKINLDQSEDDFHIYINDISVFCRGVCWTPVDFLSLYADRKALKQKLQLVQSAGMNMLRVVGTMVYETTDFYNLCDELGILVWQDFMFANMDYPVADADFSASIYAEARHFLNRTSRSPCITVLCGNSEIEQQAAMLGQSPECWSNHFFRETLPDLVHYARPDVVYWPSSPSGGVMPFQVDAGVCHYFGVGAYLRPLDDARRSGVRFTSECLGFSNMPEDVLIDRMLSNGEFPGPHPSWKRGIPRDNATSWDFEDVRDHYLSQLYQVDAMRLRYTDRERYLSLARTTTGEVMLNTLSEWRRAQSSCRGALIWFWQDLWPGAGWGVIDSEGTPKAAYYYLRRAMAPMTVLLTDEGMNGLAMHVINDTPDVFNGDIELCLIRHGDVEVSRVRIAIAIPAHTTTMFRADALLPLFFDTCYAYRFGPQGHHIAVCHLYARNSEQPLSSASYFPGGHHLAQERDLGLEARFNIDSSGQLQVQLETQRFAQAVALQIPGYFVDDNYFHLAPGIKKLVNIVPVSDEDSTVPKGTVKALNSYSGNKIQAFSGE